MFSNQLDRARQPILSRSRGILLGSILMITVAAALVSARTVAATYWVAVAGFLIAALWRRDIELKQMLTGRVALALAAFLLYALLSAAWAVSPALSLEKASLALLIAAGSLFMIASFTSETQPNLVHMGEGLFIGLLVGVLYLLFEVLSDQALKIWVFRALALRPEDLTPPRFFEWRGENLVYISLESTAT